MVSDLRDRCTGFLWVQGWESKVQGYFCQEEVLPKIRPEA